MSYLFRAVNQVIAPDLIAEFHLSHNELSAQLRVVGRIASDPAFWRVAPMIAPMSGAFIAIQTLWAGRWLSVVAGLDRASVADVLLSAWRLVS